MDTKSSYTNVQSEMGLSLRVIGRMDAFDGYPIGPGGWVPESDWRDIRSDLFVGVNSPVVLSDKVAAQAGYKNLQTFRRAIERAPNYEGSTECGSRWYLPQISNYPGCPWESALYTEVASLHAPEGAIHVRAMTGGEGLLLREVRITDTSSSSTMIYGMESKLK